MLLMRRLWLLLWYFTRPDRPQAGNAPSWYKDEISRSDFWAYLAYEKHFMEDWRSTLRNGYYFLGGTRPTQTTERGMKLAHKQKRDIDDLIDNALKYEYLLVARTSSQHPTDSETFLTIDWRGRNFLKPLSFFNDVLKKYGYVSSFLLGTGGTLLVTFWSKIINFIAILRI